METTLEMTYRVPGVRTTYYPNKKWLNPAWQLLKRDAGTLSRLRKRSSKSSKPFQRMAASKHSHVMWNNLQKLNETKPPPSSEATTRFNQPLEMTKYPQK